MNDLSAKSGPSDAPSLRFKKEDFVPIPEMAPIPLDNPNAPARKPLQVNVPNIESIQQPQRVVQQAVAQSPQPTQQVQQPIQLQPVQQQPNAAPRILPPAQQAAAVPPAFSAPQPVTKTIASKTVVIDIPPSELAQGTPDAPAIASATTKHKKGFLGRLVSHLTPGDDEDDAAPTPKTSAAAKRNAQYEQLFTNSANPPPATNAPSAAQLQRKAFPSAPQQAASTVASVPVPLIAAQELAPPQNTVSNPIYQSPGIVVQRETVHVNPSGSAVAANTIIAPVATPSPRNYSALAPAAGGDTPLIPIADAPAPLPPSPTKPIAVATPPTAPSAPAPVLPSGVPLIALPGDATATSTANASATSTANATLTATAAKPQAATPPATVVAATPPAASTIATPVATADKAPLPPVPIAAAAPPPPPKEPVVAVKPADAPLIANPSATAPATVAAAPPEKPSEEKQAEDQTQKPKRVTKHSAAKTAPPKMLTSPLWESQPKPQHEQPAAIAQAQPEQMPWATQAPASKPIDTANYGASARAPEPTITSGPIGPTSLPANVPAYAIQRWSGPDAVTADNTHTLPSAIVAPPPSQTPYPADTGEREQEMRMEAQAAAQDMTQPANPQAQMPQQPQRPIAAAPVYTPPKQAASMQPLPAAPFGAATPPVANTQPPLPATPDTSGEPKRSLSQESKQIVQNLQTMPVQKNRGPSKPVFIDHSRDLTNLDVKPQPEATVTHETQGVKIEIKPPAINYDYELEKAYNALISGQSEVAIGIYKRVLDNEPNNKNALFGLATTYHRAGQLNLARPMYSRLLTVDPGNSDGLNNFLVLLSDEAPEEALVELQKLSERNPQYSALPAQIAVIYQKLGNFNKAGEYMFKAIEMAPENITYRYNFAIMLDKQHKYDEAAKLYRQIVQAYQRGEQIPGNIQKIQQRLIFISSNKLS